jgi:hypothetical protein
MTKTDAEDPEIFAKAIAHKDRLMAIMSMIPAAEREKFLRKLVEDVENMERGLNKGPTT